jgi:hypothetical protein
MVYLLHGFALSVEPAGHYMSGDIYHEWPFRTAHDSIYVKSLLTENFMVLVQFRSATTIGLLVNVAYPVP